MLRSIHDDLDGVLLIRDDDRQTARRQGLEQARVESPLADRIVIGLAHCKRECWILAGFDPLDGTEAALLQEERQQLGFDPRLAAELLTAKHHIDPRSAKRVLGRLTADNREREAQCWATAPLDALHQRGENSGLADFLKQVGTIIVPRFAGCSSRF